MDPLSVAAIAGLAIVSTRVSAGFSQALVLGSVLVVVVIIGGGVVPFLYRRGHPTAHGNGQDGEGQVIPLVKAAEE